MKRFSKPRSLSQCRTRAERLYCLAFAHQDEYFGNPHKSRSDKVSNLPERTLVQRLCNDVLECPTWELLLCPADFHQLKKLARKRKMDDRQLIAGMIRDALWPAPEDELTSAFVDAARIFGGS